MIVALCKLLLTFNAHAEEFQARLGAIGAIHERANDLLRQAGALDGTDAFSMSREEGPKPFLKVYDLTSRQVLREGALLFGTSSFRLLVGNDPSPVQVKIGMSERHPWASGLVISGTARQGAGRIFVEFDRLFLNSGKAIPIHAVALDPAGGLGVIGKTENPKFLEVAGATALGLLTSPDESQDILGFGSVVRRSPQDRLRESLLSETKSYIKEEIKQTPVLRLDMDTPITLLFKEEVRL
jgi:hypothetical protein